MEWKTAKKTLHWLGPVILTSLGILWLMQGFSLLPFYAPWLGGVLLVIGIARLVMFRYGYY